MPSRSAPPGRRCRSPPPRCLRRPGAARLVDETAAAPPRRRVERARCRGPARARPPGRRARRRARRRGDRRRQVTSRLRVKRLAALLDDLRDLLLPPVLDPGSPPRAPRSTTSFRRDHAGDGEEDERETECRARGTGSGPGCGRARTPAMKPGGAQRGRQQERKNHSLGAADGQLRPPRSAPSLGRTSGFLFPSPSRKTSPAISLALHRLQPPAEEEADGDEGRRRRSARRRALRERPDMPEGSSRPGPAATSRMDVAR